MEYCPPNITLNHPWIDRGLTRCFLDTVSTSVITGFLLVFGTIQSLFYRKYSTNVQPRLWRSSHLYIVQILVSLILTILPIVECLVQLYLVHDGVMYGYLVLYTLGNMIVWPLSIHLLILEKISLLPSAVSRRGHGLILLLFWTFSFIILNLEFINLHSEDSWFQLQTTAQVVEFCLFVVRYIATCLAFLLGLKAPGLYSAERSGLIGSSGVKYKITF